MFSYYTAVIFIAMASLGIMAVIVAGNSILPHDKKHGFLITFLMILTAALCEWLANCLDGAAAFRGLHIAAKWMEFSLTPFVPVVCAGTLGSSRRYLRILPVLAVHAALEFLSVFYGFIFFIGPDNVYHRSGGYFIYIAAFALGILFLFYESYQFSKTYQKRNGYVILMILVFLSVGLSPQFIDREIRVDWLCVALSTMLLYIYYSELIQQMDPLTLLLNRRSYEVQTENLRKPAVILMLDVDRFKEINDTYGHSFGDKCLAAVGEELKAAYGKAGMCYRIGGDEFCVILTRYLDRVEKYNAALAHNLALRRVWEPNLPKVSVGYAYFYPTQGTIDEAIREADSMMYRCKKQNHEQNG